MPDNSQNTIPVTASGVIDFLNPFSAGSVWMSQSDLWNLKISKADTVPALLKNSYGNWLPFNVWSANSPLTDAQISALGANHQQDMMRAGATESEARLSRYEVEKYAKTITSADHDASLGGMIENNLPEIPDVTKLSTIVLVVVIALIGLIVYSEVK